MSGDAAFDEGELALAADIAGREGSCALLKVESGAACRASNGLAKFAELGALSDVDCTTIEELRWRNPTGCAAAEAAEGIVELTLKGDAGRWCGPSPAMARLSTMGPTWLEFAIADS